MNYLHDVKILEEVQIQPGTVNDNPNHAFKLRLPTGEAGWVAGPHGVSCCAISDWLCAGLTPEDTQEAAIARGCGEVSHE